jgi:hypothetical protein
MLATTFFLLGKIFTQKTVLNLKIQKLSDFLEVCNQQE